jgi:2-keto-3-deoxy-L-rhamnonate aldolase RhmA
MKPPNAPSGNDLLDTLSRGSLVTAMMIRSARTPDVVRVARASGHGSIIVDLEHSSMDLDAVATMTSTAGDLGMVPFVRVPERDYGSIGRVLDGGASGIIAARIETAAQAVEIARACRFAPRGQRSQIAMVPQFGFRPMPARELNPLLDRAVIVQILIETPQGVSNADAIAEVDGVDMLAIGANDLCAEFGLPGAFGSEQLRNAVTQVAAACARHGKLCVIGGVSDLKLMAQFLTLGVAPFIISGSDIEMLASAARSRGEALQQWHSALAPTTSKQRATS